MNVPTNFAPPVFGHDGRAMFYNQAGSAPVVGWPVEAMHAGFPAGMPMETPQAAAWRNRLSQSTTGQLVVGQHGVVANRSADPMDFPGMPLHQAARDGNLRKLAMLLNRGLPVDCRTEAGLRPLTVALLSDQSAVARLLIERGAAVIGSFGPLDAPLFLAADRGNVEIASLLLDHGAGLEARDAYGFTPLLRAVNSGQCAVVDMLINRGADLSASGPRGATPLHLAVSTHRSDILLFVLQGRAPLGAKDASGDTPLAVAHRVQNWPAVNFLQTEPERRELALKLLPGILAQRAQAAAMPADIQGAFPVPSQPSEAAAVRQHRSAPPRITTHRR